MADQHTVEACPGCDSTNFRALTSHPAGSHRQDDADYACKNCTHRFDEPVERESRQHSASQDHTHGLPKTLSELDPDDVGFTGGDA